MPREKISNGDFSSGLDDWTVNNPTGGSAPTADSGGRVSFNAAEESSFGDSIEQNFEAVPGNTQTVSLNLIESNGGNASHTFLIEILDSDGTVIASETRTVLDQTTQAVSFSFTPTTATSTLRITNTNAAGNHQGSDGKVANVSITCFLRGTLIETCMGPVCVEKLRPGMLIKTLDQGYTPLQLALSHRVDCTLSPEGKLAPVRISAGALGDGLPRQDLLVSRQHRMLVSSQIARQIFGCPQVLLPAIQLTALPGVQIDRSIERADYYHLVFNKHQVLFANGAPSESFYPGPQAIRSLSATSQSVLFSSFPELRNTHSAPTPARMLVKGTLANKLIAAHLKNRTAMFSPAADYWRQALSA